MKHEVTYGKARAVCRLEDEDVLVAQALNVYPDWMTKNNPSPKEFQQWKDQVALWLFREFRKKAGKKQKLVLTQQQLQMTAPPPLSERECLYSVLRHHLFGDVKSDVYFAEKRAGIGSFEKKDFLKILDGLKKTKRSADEILSFLAAGNVSESDTCVQGLEKSKKICYIVSK